MEEEKHVYQWASIPVSENVEKFLAMLRWAVGEFEEDRKVKIFTHWNDDGEKVVIVGYCLEPPW